MKKLILCVFIAMISLCSCGRNNPEGAIAKMGADEVYKQEQILIDENALAEIKKRGLSSVLICKEEGIDRRYIIAENESGNKYIFTYENKIEDIEGEIRVSKQKELFAIKSKCGGMKSVQMYTSRDGYISDEYNCGESEYYEWWFIRVDKSSSKGIYYVVHDSHALHDGNREFKKIEEFYLSDCREF
ncbi:MAG: hypothetical protein BM556_02565 [Bacteriovorax sp. MedPE-SWde]|nr:MAG: hypothetical protein BM556_02565 [Bacteriovorax sp. MedPE-SWde]